MARRRQQDRTENRTGSRNDTRTDRQVFHRIDYLDVALSERGVDRVERAARLVASRHMPAARPEDLTAERALALFLDHVFWEERTGGLYLCADLERARYCLPIPGSEWGLRPVAGPLQ